MTVADMKAAVALAVEQVLGLVQTDDAPKVPAPTPTKATSDELRAKRLAGLEKARAAKKAKAVAKPAAAKPAAVAPAAAKPVAKPAAESKKQTPKPGTWTVKKHTTTKGVEGKIVTVGPFSAWIPTGDAAKEQAAIDAINLVFRSTAAVDLAKAIRA
jgi:hypothetical protein